MDLELLKFRAEIMQKIRSFFIEKDYLELDTPALSSSLIPETCLEVFKTEYVEPWTGEKKDMYLVPSPEIYMKRIISQHKVSVFQLSKCYRNVESAGRIHSPEFTMLEYYTMNASYKESMAITEDLFNVLLPPMPTNGEPGVHDARILHDECVLQRVDGDNRRAFQRAVATSNKRRSRSVAALAPAFHTAFNE